MSALLPAINSPEDMRRLTPVQLAQLAGELRAELINVVSQTGGHLASNLGVVELTLALHITFDFEHDRLVWDVGHQSYVHKLITGRYKQFPTLRQFGGISGFPKPQESRYDHFVAGHSSTSISAALGMALVRDLEQRKQEVVAVIGDGALTGGIAWEALNHAGDVGTRLVVVLNDNEMSIARNVGALSTYLARARSTTAYRRTKADVASLLKRVPLVGERLAGAAERIKDSLKYLLVPGMLFEELGFTYLGPVDGHNLSALCSMLDYAKSLSGPVLVHCITTKGKGYRQAEQNPDRFHGPGPFDPTTGRSLSVKRRPTYTEVFSQALIELADKRRDILAITAAMPGGTGLDAFQKRFPERTYDVGIAEQHAVTMAAGMAASGYRPVFAVYSTFLQRAYDQLIHDVCLPNLPVVLAIDRAGLVGADGETHQGVFDLAMLRQMPNMTVLAPRDEQELVNLLHAAIEMDGPVAIRYPRGESTGPHPVTHTEVEFGRSVCLTQGREVLLINCGTIWDLTQQVAANLRAVGIEPTVYDARFVKPVDVTLAQVAADHHLTVVLEEGIVAGGFGSSLLEEAGRQQILLSDILLCGIPDRFVPHGQRDQLLTAIGLDAGQITDEIMNRLGRR